RRAGGPSGLDEDRLRRLEDTAAGMPPYLVERGRGAGAKKIEVLPRRRLPLGREHPAVLEPERQRHPAREAPEELPLLDDVAARLDGRWRVLSEREIGRASG